MRYMVTGTKGWIGKMVAYAIQDTYPTIKLEGFDSGTCDYQEWNEKWQHFMWEYCNCRHDSYKPPRMIIHIGGVSDSNAGNEMCFESNFLPTVDIVDYCKRDGSLLLYFSSSSAINPTTPYGYSKYSAEQYIRKVMKPENVCILQPFNIWGPGEGSKTSPSIIHQIKNDTLPIIFNDCVRDFVYISDVVLAVLSLVIRFQPGTFQLGTGCPTHITEIPKMLDMSWERYADTADFDGYEKRRVADKEKILPDWHPTPVDKYLKHKNYKRWI